MHYNTAVLDGCGIQKQNVNIVFIFSETNQFQQQTHAYFSNDDKHTRYVNTNSHTAHHFIFWSSEFESALFAICPLSVTLAQ